MTGFPALALLHPLERIDWLRWSVHPSTVVGIAALGALYWWRAAALGTRHSGLGTRHSALGTRRSADCAAEAARAEPAQPAERATTGAGRAGAAG